MSPSRIGPGHPQTAPTMTSPIQTQRSTLCRSIWASAGNPPRQSHSALRSHTWGSSGTFVHALSACWKRRELSTWQPSRNGRNRAPTTCSKRSSYTENSFTRPWSSLQDGLTSPAWRPCWGPFMIALSYRAPLPRIPRATWDGGNAGSASPTSPDPYLPPAPLSTSKLTQMQAPELGSPLPSAQGGAHGAWPPDGSPRVGTSNGPRPLDLSYSSSTYSQFQVRASTSRSMETTGGSSRGGGSDLVETYPPIVSSGASLSYRKSVIRLYTRDTSRVLRTPQTLPPEVFTPRKLLIDDFDIPNELSPFLIGVGPAPPGQSGGLEASEGDSKPPRTAPLSATQLEAAQAT